MGSWTDNADADLVAYIRHRESRRTVKWLCDAGVLNARDPRTQFEIRRLQEVIHEMPKFDQIAPGRTTWVQRNVPRPRLRSAPHTPPPLPAQEARKRKY